MDAFYIIILLLILVTTTTTSLLLYRSTDKPKEIDIDEELNKATETISEYCLTRSEKEPCRFKLSDKLEECNCMLLKTPPEGWNHADNKRQP